MKKNCIKCHFLERFTYGIVSTYESRDSWDKDERSSFRMKVPRSGLYRTMARCYMGVWREREGEKQSTYELLKDRKRSCFFMPYDPEIMLPAGKKVFNKKAEGRNRIKSYILPGIAIIIALVSLWFSVLQNYRM